MKRAYMISVILFAFLLLGGCSTTMMFHSSIFHNGKVLKPMQVQVSGQTYQYIPLTGTIDLGLPLGFQLTAGYGLHGFSFNTYMSNGFSLNGPEIYITKQIINAGDLFYMSATAGSQFYLDSQQEGGTNHSFAGWLGTAGLNFGIHIGEFVHFYAPAKFYYYDNSYMQDGVLRINGNGYGMIVGIGVGFDFGNFIIDAAYSYPIMLNISNTTGGELGLLVPQLGIQAGVKF